MIARYAGVVLDLDGVCCRGDRAIPGAAEAIAQLRAAGVGVAFATNNTTQTPERVAETLLGVGLPVKPEEIVSSATAAAALVQPGTRCLVVGMTGLRAALAERGCSLVDDPGDAQAVVVGLDRNLTYDHLVRGTRALLAGARFIASNTDRSFPVADGITPGAGAIVAALATASARQPEVAGKPQPAMFEAAAARLPEGPKLMVGDRVETDIAGAAALGWDTALVLTGVTDAHQARTADPTPTYLAPDLAALVALPARAS